MLIVQLETCSKGYLDLTSNTNVYRNLAKRVQKGNHPTIKKAILYFGDLDKRATMYESFGEIPPSRMKRKYAVCAKNEGNDRKVKGKTEKG